MRAKNIRDAILGVPSSPDPAVMSISALKGLAGTNTGRANSTVGAALKPSGTVSFEALCNSDNPLTPQVLTRTLEVKARVRDTGMWTCRLCNKNFVAKTDNLKRHSASHSAKTTTSTIHSMLASARGKATDNDASTVAPTLLMSLGMAHSLIESMSALLPVLQHAASMPSRRTLGRKALEQVLALEDCMREQLWANQQRSLSTVPALGSLAVKRL